MDAWLDVEALEYEPSLHTVFVQHRVVPFLGGTPDEEIIAGSVEKLRKVLEVYRVRGAADRAQVPGRRLCQPRGPQPLPLHELLHGHALRVVRRVPSREGVVGGRSGKAGGAQGGRDDGIDGRPLWFMTSVLVSSPPSPLIN
ncbi:hypothetical protein PR202_gb20329 [Eleusine coracana subsp. coracana]|uniref:Uncharacterized protein n=1 Tax=Eleusine coracana subsp. coracana TaxID=191504 RepID=A0AAV5F890_ELECO|nr:hypothetical protein PR202_gb20329 [Eleusine coracana subsp. coracana]